MKTDRFADSIRRKLESLRPDFTEKDWLRMQATLQQAGVPQNGPTGSIQPFRTVWTARPWLMAAASVGALALVSYAAWQHNEISTLRHTIGELKQHTHPTLKRQQPNNSAVEATPGGTTPTEAESVAVREPGAQPTVIHRTDTVYITRYLRERPQSIQAEAPDPQQREIPAAQQRYAHSIPSTSANRLPAETNSINPSSPAYSQPSTSPVTPVSPNTNQENRSLPESKPVTPTANERYTGKPTDVRPNRTDSRQLAGSNGQAAERYAQQRSTILRRDRPTENRSAAGSLNTNPGNSSPINSEAGTGSAPASGNGEVSQVSERQADAATLTPEATDYQQLASLPLSTKSANWNAPLALRARKLRPTRTVTISGTTITAPESQSVQQVASRVRLGAGGEVSAHLWSAGAFSEFILGKHITLGVGLSRATYLAGTFLTARDFDNRTHRDFEHELGPGTGLPPALDPNGDILNINTQVVRWQIPLNIGYRIPLGKSFALLPGIGTYLNLSSKENVSFYYRVPQRGFLQASYSSPCQADLFSGLALSTGLEWQQKHWVFQAIPVVTLPTSVSNLPGPKWEQNTTVSLRARVLYQF